MKTTNDVRQSFDNKFLSEHDIEIPADKVAYIYHLEECVLKLVKELESFSKIYIANYHCGYRDCLHEGILYVGNDIELAKKSIIKHDFEDQYNKFGWIEIWENGSRIGDIDIIRFSVEINS